MIAGVHHSFLLRVHCTLAPFLVIIVQDEGKLFFGGVVCAVVIVVRLGAARPLC